MPHAPLGLPLVSHLRITVSGILSPTHCRRVSSCEFVIIELLAMWVRMTLEEQGCSLSFQFWGEKNSGLKKFGSVSLFLLHGDMSSSRMKMK